MGAALSLFLTLSHSFSCVSFCFFLSHSLILCVLLSVCLSFFPPLTLSLSLDISYLSISFILFLDPSSLLHHTHLSLSPPHCPSPASSPSLCRALLQPSRPCAPLWTPTRSCVWPKGCCRGRCAVRRVPFSLDPCRVSSELEALNEIYISLTLYLSIYILSLLSLFLSVFLYLNLSLSGDNIPFPCLLLSVHPPPIHSLLTGPPRCAADAAQRLPQRGARAVLPQQSACVGGGGRPPAPGARRRRRRRVSRVLVGDVGVV